MQERAFLEAIELSQALQVARAIQDQTANENARLLLNQF